MHPRRIRYDIRTATHIMYNITLKSKVVHEDMDSVRGGNRADRVGFEFGRVGSGKFDQKNCRVTGRVRVNLIWVGSGFGSSIVGFFSYFGSFWAGSGFRFLVAQIISDFGSFGFGSGRVSGHVISDSIGFQLFWVGPGRLLGHLISNSIRFRLFRVGLDFGSLDFKKIRNSFSKMLGIDY
jgi:hypothetical protein